MITMIILGAIFYIASLFAYLFPDWKPRTFLNFYSDAMFLGAAIAAKETIFIVIFAAATLLSVRRIYIYTRLYLVYKNKKEVNPVDQ